MYFLSTFTILLAAISTSIASEVAADILPRDGTRVLYDIWSIDAAVRNMTTLLQAWQGDITQTPAIFSAMTNVHSINRKAYTDTTGSVIFTIAQSLDLANAVNSTVAVDIPAAMTVLKSKKSLFQSVQLNSIILAYVKQFRFDHDTLSLAIATRMLAGQPLAAVASSTIDQSLAAAIIYWSY